MVIFIAREYNWQFYKRYIDDLLRIVLFVYFDETNELEQVYVKMLIKFQILVI